MRDFDLVRLEYVIARGELPPDLAARYGRAAWHRDARCLEHPELDFFPERGEIKEIKAAKAVCASCAVRRECLLARWDERLGVWGGTSRRDRQRAKTKGMGVDQLLAELDARARKRRPATPFVVMRHSQAAARPREAAK